MNNLTTYDEAAACAHSFRFVFKVNCIIFEDFSSGLKKLDFNVTITVRLHNSFLDGS